MSQKSKAQKYKLAWFRNVKENSPCVVCEEDEPVVIEFHHLDPRTKSGNVSQMARDSYTPLEAVKKEIDKCIPVCANCHKKIHGGVLSVTFADVAGEAVTRKKELSIHFNGHTIRPGSPSTLPLNGTRMAAFVSREVN